MSYDWLYAVSSPHPWFLLWYAAFLTCNQDFNVFHARSFISSVNKTGFRFFSCQSFHLLKLIFQGMTIIRITWIASCAQNEGFFCRHRDTGFYKSQPKGRHSTNQKGKIRTSKTSLTAARGAKDPWLLVYSLPVNRHFSKRCVNAYKTRMQIEEGFRDMKSSRFGLGFEQNNTRKMDRLKNLILLTTLASMILILIGSVVASKGYSYRFQSNSTRSHRVLSYFYLGKRAIHTDLYIPKADWQTGIRQFAGQLGVLEY